MIAYGTGKAGQWSKDEADRRLQRAMTWLATGACGGCLLAGLAVGILVVPYLYHYVPIARRAPVAGYWTVAAAAVAAAASWVVVVVRRMEGPIDALSRERIRHLHGGQAEALVASHLRTLGDRWHLFNNVRVGGAEDVDHVLVGPGGLFCVSTKSHRGLYAWDASARTATLNGRPTDHVRQAQAMAMQLRHWMQARLRPEHGAGAVPFVHPILCVPLAAVELPAGVTRVRVVDGRQLHDLLNGGAESLKPAAVRGCVAVLKELTGWEAVRAGPASLPTA